MRRIWTPIDKTPPANTAVELRFDDGSSDLAMWIGTRWLPALDSSRHAQWRELPVRLPLFDEYPLPESSTDKVA
ncbi:MAG: hypothetical protein IAE82_09265 [Opitutaceae bacterium]|nr:hypothetical protein [Opitutaceae bacterium]